MGAIKKERWVKGLVETNDDNGQNSAFRTPLRAGLYASSMVSASTLTSVKHNEESAVRLYDQIRDYVATRGYYPGKYMRPWDIDPELYTDLDDSQPWWGFEFETGYSSQDRRAEIIRKVWDGMDNMCFDAEGEGNAHCEITFAPQELSKFEDRTAEAIKFMKLMDESRDSHISRTEAINVGTHINVSVPGLNEHNQSAINVILNNTISALPEFLDDEGMRNTRLEFFGREKLYGLFYPQASYPMLLNGNLDPDKKRYFWMEGKLFRTTYYYARFEQYMAVCDAITRCLQWLVKQDVKVLNRLRNRTVVKLTVKPGQTWATPVKGAGPYFSNFVQMVIDGDEPQIENWFEGEEVSDDGSGGLVKAFRIREPASEELSAAVTAAVAEQSEAA